MILLRDRLWGSHGKYAGSDRCGICIGKRGRDAVHHHDRNDGTLGWRDGDSQRSRADQKMVRKIKAVYPFSFPGIPKGHKVQEYIAANMIANILGLGSAATPDGIKSDGRTGKNKKRKRSARRSRKQ